jgi:hypothetical protein
MNSDDEFDITHVLVTAIQFGSQNTFNYQVSIHFQFFLILVSPVGLKLPSVASYNV